MHNVITKIEWSIWMFIYSPRGKNMHRRGYDEFNEHNNYVGNGSFFNAQFATGNSISRG